MEAGKTTEASRCDGARAWNRITHPMKQSKPQSDWRLVHGIAFVLLMGCNLLIPALRRWPWVWLAPLATYFFIVACVPPLRRSLGWVRLGRLSTAGVAVTLGIMVLTTFTLVVFQTTAQPDVRSFRAALPFEALGGIITAGVVFSLVNATLEEMVFRGVLFEALQSQWGAWMTVTGTAVLFGLGHLHGYPSGPAGTCLAAGFGLLTGGLRLWTGGLLLPIVAHISADATIYAILVHSGAV